MGSYDDLLSEPQLGGDGDCQGAPVSSMSGEEVHLHSVSSCLGLLPDSELISVLPAKKGLLHFIFTFGYLSLCRNCSPQASHLLPKGGIGSAGSPVPGS